LKQLYKKLRNVFLSVKTTIEKNIISRLVKLF